MHEIKYQASYGEVVVSWSDPPAVEPDSPKYRVSCSNPLDQDPPADHSIDWDGFAFVSVPVLVVYNERGDYLWARKVRTDAASHWVHGRYPIKPGEILPSYHWRIPTIPYPASNCPKGLNLPCPSALPRRAA